MRLFSRARLLLLLLPVLLDVWWRRSGPPRLDHFEATCGVAHPLTASERDTAATRLIASLPTWKVRRGRLSFANNMRTGSPATTYGAFNGFQGDVLVDILARLPFGIGPRLFRGLFRMAASDALVFIGCTPPEVEYFSVAPYLWLTGTSLPGAQLGPSLNHLRVGFNATVAYVASADRQTLKAVVAALNNTFDHVLEVGLPHQPGLLRILWRVSGGQGAEHYLRKSQPAFILKPPAGSKDFFPFEMPDQPPATGRQDDAFVKRASSQIDRAAASLQEKLEARLLAKRRLQLYEYSNYECVTNPRYQPSAKFLPASVRPLPSTCAMTSSDSTITVLPGEVKLNESVFAVVVGVDYKKAHRATLHSLMLSQLPPHAPTRSYYENPETIQLWHAAELTDIRTLIGGEGDVPIYAAAFALRCPDDGVVPCKAPRSAVEGAFLQVTERVYLDPATRLGPSKADIVPPTLLVFERPPHK